MEKEFGCRQCNHTIKTCSPDDMHTVLSVTDTENDCIESHLKCEDCNLEFIMYWCTKDIHHAGGPLRGKKPNSTNDNFL